MDMAFLGDNRAMRGRPNVLSVLATLGLLLDLAGCGSDGGRSATADYPEALSEYGLFVGDPANQIPREGIFEYQVNAALFSDETRKRRFIALPDGGSIEFHPTEPWEYPVGTILVKTFSMPDDHRVEDGPERLLETRLIVKEANRWVALVYVWEDDESDAFKRDVGKRIPVTWIDRDGATQTENYLVPNTNQCGNCHGAEALLAPLGPRTRQLGAYDYDETAGDQLDLMEAAGLFSTSLPPAAEREAMPDPYGDAPLDARALSYLDANCGHCHNAQATQAAAATGLHLDWGDRTDAELGICKRPTAAGAGAGGRFYDIVPGDPDASVMVFRMASVDPQIKMPELPTQRSDLDSVMLISEWIAAMPGDGCD